MYPLLLPADSSHGIWISIGLIVTPFLENSLQTFVRSLSSLSLPMMGTPSTTSILSKPSSCFTSYLKIFGMRDEWRNIVHTCSQYLKSRCFLDPVRE